MTNHKQTNKIAIVVHVYYYDVWEKIAQQLKSLDGRYDLYITCNQVIFEQYASSIQKEFPSSEIKSFPNIGMDIYPFLKMVSILIKKNYELVLKLHTKKGSDKYSAVWGEKLVESLIGHYSSIGKISHMFNTHADLSMVVPATFYLSARQLMQNNQVRLTKLTKIIFNEDIATKEWGFVAGTMFWSRPDLWLELSEWAEKHSESFNQDYKKDGLTVHSLERLFGLVPTLKKKNIGLLYNGIKQKPLVQTFFSQHAFINQSRTKELSKVLYNLGRFKKLFKSANLLDLNAYKSFLVKNNLDIDSEFDFISHYLLVGQFSGALDCSLAWKMYMKNQKLDWGALNNKSYEKGLVSIIIPVFNGLELTNKCVDAIVKNTKDVVYEIIIVDNGSDSITKIGLQKLMEQYISVKIVLLETNYYFALGCNYGFSKANGETVVFLNNDTEVQLNWLRPLVQSLDNPNIYASQPQLRYEDGTLQCMGVVFSDKSSLGYPIYQGMEVDECEASKSRKFNAITAACMAIKAKDFTSVQGFDSIYINGQEDIDLCMKLCQGSDKKAAYVPESIVVHYESKTPGRRKYIDQNRYIFVERWKNRIKSDDTFYYEQDKFDIVEWNIESHKSKKISILRPVLKKHQEKKVVKRNMTLLQKGNQAFREKNYSLAYEYFLKAKEENPVLSKVVEGSIGLLIKKLKFDEPFIDKSKEKNGSKYQNESDDKTYKLIKESGIFDEAFYLEKYPDTEAYKGGAEEHYCRVGYLENRQPNASFDPVWYEGHHEDVQKDGKNPLLHYLLYGKNENRFTNQIEYNEDSMLLNKKIEEDIKSSYELIKNSDYFDREYYLSINTDVVDLGIDPVEHYLLYGYKENRNPSKKFDTQYYLETYEDVQKDGSNPLVHYLLIGHKEKRRVVKELKLDLPLIKSSNIFRNYSTSPIDIIIPVYNGLEYLEPLFNSIINNTKTRYRLLVCDDCSSDENVFPFLKSFEKKFKAVEFILLRNKTNLGFVGTVNRLVKYTKNHFVLLNTDTEVPPNWLDRLMKPILTMEKIATTTPFTNAGTICSFPNYLEDNENIMNGMSVNEIDKYFQVINFEKNYIEIPTGVGFCMGVNKKLVDEIGMFDTVFGKGYGEENDFCQRAIVHGYTNIHIPNLFVYHKHGGSFPSETKKKLIHSNLKILLEKHPTYNKQVQKTIAENKLETIRELLYFIILSNTSNRKSTLYIDHDLGGGTVDYRKMEIEKRFKNNELLCLVTFDFRSTKNYIVELTYEERSFKFMCESLKELFDYLNLLDYKEIFLNSLVSYPDLDIVIQSLLNLKTKTNARLVIPMHDFFPLCPNYVLLNDKTEYCEIPSDVKRCSQCLTNTVSAEYKQFSKETSIEKWRGYWKKILQEAEEILCFSNSSKEIFAKVYPKLINNVIVIPHDISGRYKDIYEPRITKEKRIGILGGINIAKGAYIVQNLVKYIDENNLNVKIILIGEISIDINSSSFYKTGRYKREDLPKIVKKQKITEFLIPSIWPETFSYTTDEIMQMGYPLTVFDIGAPAERVKDYKLGKIIKISEINKLFM